MNNLRKATPKDYEILYRNKVKAKNSQELHKLTQSNATRSVKGHTKYKHGLTTLKIKTKLLTQSIAHKGQRTSVLFPLHSKTRM